MKSNLDLGNKLSDQMISSMMYSKLNTFLESEGKKDIFTHIKGVKLNPNSIVIITNKPLINSELKFYESKIRKLFLDMLYEISKPHNQSIKISFR